GGWQRRRAGTEEAADAAFPLGGLGGFRGIEGVEAGAGVGVDDAEGGRLALEVPDDEREHNMLQHVREVAGMVGVAVVHSIKPGVIRQLAVGRRQSGSAVSSRLLPSATAEARRPTAERNLARAAPDLTRHLLTLRHRGFHERVLAALQIPRVELGKFRIAGM